MSRKRSGFTLLELIVVIAILAAIAGLVINKVDWVRRQATMAVGADTSGEVAQNIQTYLVTTSMLPSGLDTLLDSASGTSFYKGIIGFTDGVGSIPTTMTPTALTYSSTDKRLNSLVRMGMSFVNSHLASSTYATDSGTVPVALSNDYPAGSAGGSAVAPVASTVNLALVNVGSSVWNSVYPLNVWPQGTSTGSTMMTIDSNGTGASLVALGVGPGNSMNGVTMVTPPQFPGPNPNLYYYRYVAIFAVYTDGRRAQLKTVIEPFGRTIDSSLNNYSTGGPDDLPPNARTPE
jgi:prepilin-type N-terminal cleavage/methylation domain-containing protein